ncbi:adenylate kinase family protein [Zavarzinella formosa]|uniref:adenylate kinase family protein n=1 Tax=Zavarzinella formosa TaxID=360055 RepID=UPI0002DA5AB9|nr:nucleoside monophosphate kinase [Zavarzinella formosa]
MRLVLVGPPGSGKGTQAKMLVRRFGLRHIGTGDILRDAFRRGNSTDKRLEPVIRDGVMASDDLVNELVGELFASIDRPDAYVLDGYPRTLAQAVWFDRRMSELGREPQAVVQLCVEDEEVVRRLSGRHVCPACGHVYHADDCPPKVTGFCDHDGEMLIQRPDDREEVIRSRLRLYHTNTESLVARYRANGLLKVIPSVGEIEGIHAMIVTHLTGRS